MEFAECNKAVFNPTQQDMKRYKSRKATIQPRVPFDRLGKRLSNCRENVPFHPKIKGRSFHASPLTAHQTKGHTYMRLLLRTHVARGRANMHQMNQAKKGSLFVYSARIYEPGI
ncbi:MAG: hypothetical protein R3A44_16755 [Caldilineaceae bacterium]